MEEKKVKKVDFDLEEIKKLSEEADRNKGLQLGFEQEFENEIMSFDVIDDIQNPEKAYKVYYAIEGILRTHLPSDEKYKELRRFIREEKIIFLTGGKKKNEAGIRGADSRQAYISTHLEVVLKNLLEWIQEGTSTFELFLKLRKLNIDYGYFKEEEISEYDQKLFKQKNID
ncbi:hypothetical protein ACHRV1_05390 [Flavobacterium aquidurense]|uniref:hypothetical protein n=1 Tax=Flavobacterium aquidurense TaxID=362413 RepID=UPI0037565835